MNEQDCLVSEWSLPASSSLLNLTLFIDPSYSTKKNTEHTTLIEALTSYVPLLWQNFTEQMKERNHTLAFDKSPESSNQQKTRWELTLYVITDDRMRALNSQFRDKNSSTDVLTFPNYASNLINPAPEIDLGSIFVSLDWALTHVEDETSILKYLAERFIHGWLHTFGYHHDTEESYNSVTSIQQQVLITTFNNETT